MPLSRTVRTLPFRFLLLLLLAACSDRSTTRAPKPNIIFILADDLSYRDLSGYGQQHYSTPHLDRLAAEGLRFTRAYAGASLCAPSRASLLTGMHMGHARIRNNTSVRGQDHLLDEDLTIAEVLKSAGYATGFIGKWGLGLPGTEGVPENQGFDHAYGFYDQRRAHTYFPEFMIRNGAKVPLPENVGFAMQRVYRRNRSSLEAGKAWANRYDARGQLIADGVADPRKATYSEHLFQKEALSFIERNQNGPFFLYYATQLPHGPTIIPDLGKFHARDWPLRNREWAAMVEKLDESVGMIVDKLESVGLLEHTVIFFAGDNGYSMHGYMGREAWADDPIFRNKGPWKNGKGSTYEGGLRVPFFVYGKGRIPAGSSDRPTALYDFFATAAEWAGHTEPLPTDGISLVPTLTGDTGNQKDHRYLYWERHHEQALNMGPWHAYRPHPARPVELYRIEADPGCEQDLASAHPDVVDAVERIFATARVDSAWYVDPGETEEATRAKRQRAVVSRTLQPSSPPNASSRKGDP